MDPALRQGRTRNAHDAGAEGDRVAVATGNESVGPEGPPTTAPSAEAQRCRA
ncbi:DUF6053 domain-containing protein [Lysobacter enzymogenes]|uniref:DUF6053 domain-containing protein n=1 Tax=Lysobacter enzymogenes TaxID=69 RepID=UPI003D2F54D0